MKIQETMPQLDIRYTQTILSLTRTIGMTRTKMDISKPGLMRGTVGSTLLTTIVTNHLL